MVGHARAKVDNAVVTELRDRSTRARVQFDQAAVSSSQQNPRTSLSIARPIRDTTVVLAPRQVWIISPDFFAGFRFEGNHVCALTRDIQESTREHWGGFELPPLLARVIGPGSG